AGSCPPGAVLRSGKRGKRGLLFFKREEDQRRRTVRWTPTSLPYRNDDRRDLAFHNKLADAPLEFEQRRRILVDPPLGKYVHPSSQVEQFDGLVHPRLVDAGPANDREALPKKEKLRQRPASRTTRVSIGIRAAKDHVYHVLIHEADVVGDERPSHMAVWAENRTPG
ncbi:MAG: hypothetical protein BJ554DRAFT_4203, partial [Olpidium bornovanus]